CAGTGRMVKAGISMTHLHILWVLEHHGELPMSRLAELLDVSLSNATGLIDRMEERHLVERVRVPDDRRMVIVRASAEGARIRDEIEALKQDRMRSILSRLTPNQLDRILGTIGDLFWGKLSDLYGRKPMFMIGIVIFLIGSALSGLSQNMTELIAFRGFQGIGAGSLFPIALATIGDLFTPAERGKYQGLFGAVFGIAFIVGPLVG